MAGWEEVGPGVLVRRYAFLDQNVGVVLGDDGVLLVDTRASIRQAREVRRHLRELTALPLTAVVNTHGHADHAFGNGAFRPAPIWAHARCPSFLVRTAAEQARWLRATFPSRAAEFQDRPLDLPDRLVDGRATIDLGGRVVELRHLGRGHTDHDLVVIVADAQVVFAGDLIENGAPPAFEDAFPVDWAATARELARLVDGVVVPGHGDPAGPAFAAAQAVLLGRIAELAGLVHAGLLTPDAAIRGGPLEPAAGRLALDRALWELRGEPA